MPSLPEAPTQPAEQQQDQLTSVIDDDNEVDLPVQPLPVHQPAPKLPQPNPEQPLPAARQIRSGRVLRNTPRYEQSISQ